MDNIHIEIPSISENIRMIESFIDNARESFKLNDDIYGNIMIAITEAVNNAIKHGNRSDSRKNVSLSLILEKVKLSFAFRTKALVLTLIICLTLLLLKT